MPDLENNDQDDLKTQKQLAVARADLKALRAEYTAAVEEVSKLTIRLENSTAEHAKVKGDLETALASMTQERDTAVEDSKTAMTRVQAGHEQALIASKAEIMASRLGAHNPEDVVRLLDLSTVTRDDKGSFVGLEDIVNAAKTQRGYMFGEAPKTHAQAGDTSVGRSPMSASDKAASVPAMSDAEYAAARKAEYGY